ncbi:hypothetical protein ILUMI_10552 [Ignelater luminosus]|uniref:VLRF1 domain-containing protein n=1 Tax=Ignelater luminosus TaxID=2038154 RepID=A0A8K0D269_IGNLU|nr:hypothetical protein ILUMI_10552 [Ignelater luminosus]
MCLVERGRRLLTSTTRLEFNMEQIKLFDDSFKKIVEDEVQFLQFVDTDTKETNIEKDTWTTTNPTSLSCSYCRVEFSNSLQQREHYKLDWHRYNLKQSLLAREPITEEEFNEKTDDISSISGSESEEKEDSLENIAAAQGKIFLKTGQGKVFSVYRCLLFEKKDELDGKVLIQRLRSCSTNSKWTVLMLGGGHFAGGVFHGSEPVLHKTFHCYTVRAGQGSSQGARDNRSGGSQPKSAGASLRRYNEAALVQHVRDIVEAWRSEIDQSSLIIFRAAGPYNRGVLFGGKTPLLNRADPRLRSIPFSTRRATYTELKRVHNLLTTLHIYESTELALQQLPKQETIEQSNKRNKCKVSNINRSKSREITERPLPVASHVSSSSESEPSETNNKDELTINEQEVSFRDALQCFDDTLTPEDRKKGNRKAKKPKKSKNRLFREREARRRKELYETIQSGKLDILQVLLDNRKIEHEGDKKIGEVNESEENVKHQSENIEFDFINEVLDDHGNTLLHVAALFGQIDILKYLLDNNADPCNKNDKHQTPYTCTQDKEVRSLFKDYAQQFPEKYNYNKAHIPTNVLSVEEQFEKKKAQRKVKREKEKEKKKENAIKKKEETEKERFLNLSDREKRALAAERRILSQSGTVMARCFLCATDISGKVPFEYSGNRFCSIECLKAHRLNTPAVLPQ